MKKFILKGINKKYGRWAYADLTEVFEEKELNKRYSDAINNPEYKATYLKIGIFES